MSGYRALVIGATGAVGSALVRELLWSARCHAMTMLTRRPPGMFTGVPGAAKLTQRVAGAFARGCRAAGVRHMTLLTAVGANARSRVYYLRLKGAVEERYRSLAFGRLSLFRPSVLVTRELRHGLQDWITRHLDAAGFPAAPVRFP